MQVHSDYVIALAKALWLTQQQNYEGAQDAVKVALDYLNMNELAIQKVMDGNKAKMHWNRRLDPQKCRSIDVM